MKIESGSVLGHYEIGELLGKGGMGEVWRARDTRLKREVALKTLPPEMAADRVRLGRFQQEAEAVARLSHPHIVTLFSFEEEAGIRFLTMELVEGKSLDQVLSPEGLPLDQVLRIGIAVADALAAAHDKHIVHRDLKPGNILVSEAGGIKVLDFGLAKLTENAPETGFDPEGATGFIGLLTREGAVMGTVPYMSPEQARGMAVDFRSDTFSLGIVLYELVTGHRPFLGKTMTDITSAILRDTPPPVTDLKPGLPPDLGRIIAQCLEKEPDRRTRSARDIQNDLQALQDEVRLSLNSGRIPSVTTTPAPAPPPAADRRKALIGLTLAVAVLATTLAWVLNRNSADGFVSDGVTEKGRRQHSIAVLPFVNMSSNKEQEYFSDGISEALLTLLAKVPQLKVAARTSSYSFKGKGVEIPEIARQLHVTHVLEGSVRRSGDRVRITVQLIHAADGFHVWSQTFDRKLDDIFAIQDEIAGEVVRELEVKILGAPPKARPTDPKAYALYLQAEHLGRLYTVDAFKKSDALYRQALAIDPRYAPAWDGLARNVGNEAQLDILPQEAALDQGREAAEKALEIDPDYAPALARLGSIAMVGNDLAGAARHFERALALDPGDPSVRGNATRLLYSLGRLDEALPLQEDTVRRDPVNATAIYNLGFYQLWAGRSDKAIASFRLVLSLSPGRGGAHSSLGMALLQKEDPKGALAAVEQETNEAARMMALPMAFHALGRKADSDAAFAALAEKMGKEQPVEIAAVHAFRGESDQAFAWLNKAAQGPAPYFAEVVVDNRLAKLRNDPRWLPFLRRIGKAPEQLARIKFKVPAPPKP